jgi:hypothetical protein
MGTMTSRRHLNSWRELGGESRMKSAVTKLLNVLENAGLLLPEAAAENEEVTISSGNVRKYFDFFGIPLTCFINCSIKGIPRGPRVVGQFCNGVLEAVIFKNIFLSYGKK